MIKKLTYFTFILITFLLFSKDRISAKEYCHIYQDNHLEETIELPFYFYEISRESILKNHTLPIITYNKIETYIDSLTKCELINKTITFDIFDILKKSEIATYSKEQILLTNEELFNSSIFTLNGSTITGLSTKEDEEPPTINGYKEKYQSNINNPLDLDFLIKSFSAHDNFDGNISQNIKIEYEEYSSNKEKVGNYLIIISVADSASNKTTATFYIQAIDTTPPLIEGKNTFISYLSSPITLEEIKSKLKVSDNSNKSLSSQIFACEDLYSPNKTNPGDYSIFFCVYDESNNLSNEFEVKITVKDDIPPIIEGLDYYETYLSSPISIKDIMYSLAASDNGKDISSSIFISDDHYSNYQNTIGEKYIYFQATDLANNASKPFKVTINLLDDISPQIFGLNIFESYLSNPLSLTYIKQQLTVIDNIDGDITTKLETINDSYSNNINNKGTFHITFMATDSSSNVSAEHKITITTIDDVKPFFIGPSSLKYQVDKKPSLESILSLYQAKDNVDGIIDINVINDTYSSSIETGTFFIHLSSTDSSNNQSLPFAIKIEVVEDLINIYETTIYLPNTTLLTIEEINNLINFNASHTVLEDSYTSNYNIKGNYTIKYELKDKSIVNLKVSVFTLKESSTTSINNKIKKETIIQKIKRFFKKILSYIKNLFSNIILIKNFLTY